MKSLLIIVLVATAAYALTDREREEASRALYNPDLFQGDIMGIAPGERNVIPYTQMRWTNAVVPYVIDSSLTGITSMIEKAMQDYHSRTCVRFVRRTTEKNYIKIFKDKGCYSYIGMLNRGEQPVSLGDGCHFVGTVIHELGHAVGFYHEQSRSDRDDHLNIYWNNIQQGMDSQFVKLTPNQNILYNSFDYSSIMIYGNYAFTRDQSLKTMEAKNGQRLLDPYDKQVMTDSDALRVNKMYNCRL